ncbi:MAG TPA: hypothetical protein VMM56_09980 [Planctomycetaceae bacterium]|nr:hypothetical protein [Planctomycetaceae bacterium]
MSNVEISETLRDPKPRSNHREYLLALSRMTPAERLKIAFALSDRSKRLLKQAIRRRFPEKTEEEIHQLFLERLDACHNNNY